MESQVAHTLDPSDTIDKLLWPPDGVHVADPQNPGKSRVYNALRRNSIVTIRQLLSLSPNEFLRMRNVGESTLRYLVADLAKYGWALSAERPHDFRIPAQGPADTSPSEGLEQAAWIGEQLQKLTQDDRVAVRTRLGVRYEYASQVENRRRAWAWYRWGITPDGDWPRDKAGGFGYMAVPLPGSVELHLAGLNALAHEELGS